MQARAQRAVGPTSPCREVYKRHSLRGRKNEHRKTMGEATCECVGLGKEPKETSLGEPVGAQAVETESNESASDVG